MKRILIVGCGFPQLGLLDAARRLGLYVIGADANSAAIGTRLCHEFHQASTNDVDAIVALAKRASVHGITTAGSELALTSTARAAALLGLPFYGDEETVRRCQDKDQMREAYRKGGAPIPNFVSAAHFEEARSFVDAHGLPVIVKPARGWGQRGVSKVERPSELLPSFERAQQASSTGTVLVEEFIDGEEFSVNAYTKDGDTVVCSVTERIITHYPDPPGITFAEWYPSGLDPAREQKAIDAAVLGIRALGIRRGPSYTQLRMGVTGPKLVETAYRLGGGLDPDVALLASGVSLFRKILGCALDEPSWEAPGPPEAERHRGVIGKFLIGKPGTVVRIDGLNDARTMPGVVAAEVYVGVGATVHPLTDGSKRVGHALAVGGDRVEADRRASRALSTIRIDTE